LVDQTSVMPEKFCATEAFRDAYFERCQLSGVVIRDCDVTGLQIVDSYVHDVSIAGDLRNVVVNDVDVTGYVEGELDRQYPERAQVREAHTADAVREVWDVIGVLWAGTIDRARLHPEAVVQERVDGEWSFVETQRHLLFCSDAWVGNTVLEEEQPYHRFGYPVSGYPPAAAAALGLDLDASPTLEEVLEARRARAAIVGRLINQLTDEELQRVCRRKPSPEYPDQQYTVGRCIRVVLREEVEHRRYAERDLAKLETHP
jgi:hypothetical protein